VIRLVGALALFGIAFGYVEAAVVVYLRALYQPIHERFHPGRDPGDLFPILTLDELRLARPEATHWLGIELGREAATLAMLLALGLAVGRNWQKGMAVFAMAFGFWDIFFYIALWFLIGWPRSFLEWDLLFLLPVPWVGPVAAPIIVSVSLITGGALILIAEHEGRSLTLTWGHLLFLGAGAVAILAAFCKDFQVIATGAMPPPFAWPLFAAGEVIGLLTLLHAWRGTSPTLLERPRVAGPVVNGTRRPGCAKVSHGCGTPPSARLRRDRAT
jgi:hypothetical protein